MSPRLEFTSRKSVMRSQNGCITCRIRRVKCDEVRPSCTRCRSTRRRCDGYLPNGHNVPRRRLADLVRQTSSLGPASESLGPVLRQSPTPQASSHDALFFDVYRHTTAPGTASLLPSRFWTRDLPQMAHREPAIWHAALSLGAVHRQWEEDRGRLQPGEFFHDGVFTRAARAHYFRAISLAKSIADTSTLRALSVVLVTVANVMGWWSHSQTHLFGGLRLLEREQDGSPEVDSAAEILERLDLQAMTFSDSQAPYPFQSPIWLRSLHRKLHGPQPITSYGQALTLLFSLLRQFILISMRETDGGDSPSTDASYDTLLAELEAWESKMQVFENLTEREEMPALTIRIYHAELRLWLAASFDGEERRWDTDECLFYFEYIVTLGEALRRELEARSVNPLSLEPAFVVPLFSTAHRCRHPNIRHRAAKILRECKRIEGMWNSDGAAMVADKIITIEEEKEGLEVNLLDEPSPDTGGGWAPPNIPWSVWSSQPPLVPRKVSWKGIKVVPESRRVKDVLVMVDYERGVADVRMLFPDILDPYEIVAVEDSVHFGAYGKVASEDIVTPTPKPQSSYGYTLVSG